MILQYFVLFTALLPVSFNNFARTAFCEGFSINTYDFHWSGTSSQDKFMREELCILVDERDNIIGCDTKLNCHLFNHQNPSGRLHRAFSVFLFDANGRLLLQQRAASKITFPSVWTNTCCSHPLFSFAMGEVDFRNEIEHGAIPGVLRAANRKLNQELGVNSFESFLHSDYRFVSRILYSAKDDLAVAGNNECFWGESELDYILFLRKDNISLQPNPEEVAATRYVTKDELRAMLADPTYKWSPWFRLIADQLLFNWWDDLDNIISDSSSQLEWRTIRKLS